MGNKAESIGAVEQIARLKRSGMFLNVPWEKIYYEEGNIEFWYNDFDQALTDLKKATASPKDLDLNSGVLAYMRQGQIYDLQNQHDLAKQAYEQAIGFAPESDAAKESRRYLTTPYRRTKS
jgi:tetratricopeptide (TPR) repeat protein